MEIPTVGPHAPRADAARHPLLLPHQLATLRAVLDVERGCEAIPVSGDADESVAARIGVLGDKPGSGKSYVVADLLLNCGHDHIPRSSPVRRQISCSVAVTTRPIDDQQERLALSLLVVPHNIVSQWSRVLEEFGAGNRLKTVSRTVDLAAASEIVSALAEGESPVRMMMISASFYPDVVAVLRGNRCCAARVVFDEADSLRFRNPHEHRCAAGFHWFVTASVHNLFCSSYSSGEPLVLMHSNGAVSAPMPSRAPACNSGHVRSFFSFNTLYWSRFVSRLVVVADNAFVDSSFDLTPHEEFRVRCAAPLHTRVLSGIASRDVLSRLNAGDLDAALVHLHPERTDSEQNIISAALAQFRLELDNANAVLDFMQRRRYAARSQLDTALTRQRAKIARLEGNIRNVKERIQCATECLICFSPMASKTVVPCCSNSFCLSCITTWVTAANPSCPMCKQLLRTTDFMVCSDDVQAQPREQYEAGGVTFDRLRSKAQNLTQLLRKLSRDRASKLLLFCDSEYALENAGKRAMESAGIPFSSLKGNTASINKRVCEFNEATEPRALLINCSHYGCGLNLNKATDVIIYHTVDSRMDQQIIGRAQRAPRSGRLRVWRFINCTEVL